MFLSERELRHMRGKFCGPNLSGVLSVICHGKYNSPVPHKKSGMKILVVIPVRHVITVTFAVSEDNEEMFDYPFLPKRSAFDFITDGVNKRGVVEECCDKSCSLSELRSYCR